MSCRRRTFKLNQLCLPSQKWTSGDEPGAREPSRPGARPPGRQVRVGPAAPSARWGRYGKNLKPVLRLSSVQLNEPFSDSE